MYAIRKKGVRQSCNHLILAIMTAGRRGRGAGSDELQNELDCSSPITQVDGSRVGGYGHGDGSQRRSVAPGQIRSFTRASEAYKRADPRGYAELAAGVHEVRVRCLETVRKKSG